MPATAPQVPEPQQRLGSRTRWVIGILALSVVATDAALILYQRLRWPPVTEANITALPVTDFRDQLQEAGLLPPNDQAPSLFRPLPESASLKAAASQHGLTEEQILAELRQLDVTPEALSAGPHVDCVTYEGTLETHVGTLHSVQCFRNASLDIWVLREKRFYGDRWRTYALVQDKTVRPNLARYFIIKKPVDGQPSVIKARGATCYECHASGPRALRGIRPDLVSGARYGDEMNAYVRSQDPIETRFTDAEPRQETTGELNVGACTQCHSPEGKRASLHPENRRSVDLLTKLGAMPPKDKKITPQEAADLQAWIQSAASH